MTHRFSSRHLVIVVVAVCTAVVLAPTTVVAAAKITSVKITYAGKAARVDRTGHLSVGDGSGPLTVDGKVSTSGPLSTIVIGAGFINDGTSPMTSPTTASLAVTGLMLSETRLNSTTAGSDLTVSLQQVAAPQGVCGSAVLRTLFTTTLSSGQSVEVAPSTPVLVKASGSTAYCLALYSYVTNGAVDATPYYPKYTLTAYTVSGTYAGTGTASAPARAQLPERKPDR